MDAFCNYLRGVELKRSNDEEENDPKVAKTTTNIDLIEIIKKTILLLKHLFPRFMSVATLLFVILLIDTIALEFVVYQVGLLGSKYFKVLLNKDSSGFTLLAILSLGLILLNSFMRSLSDFISALLGIVWRKYITLRFHDLYFLNKNFYYIQQEERISSLSFNKQNNHQSSINTNSIDMEPIDSPTINKNNKHYQIDNPDQRITQDINSMCTSISNILPILLISPFVIAYYTYDVIFLL
jgi:ATP-binding cassette, subfamily D (ALD), member 4